MAKKINPHKLKKGDVVLTGVDAFKEALPIKIGNIFRGRLGSIKWTHAAMSLGNSLIVESIPDPGVNIRNIQDTYIDNGIDILVLRCKMLTQKQAEDAANFCVSKISEKSRYDPRALSYFVLHFIGVKGDVSPQPKPLLHLDLQAQPVHLFLF